MDIDAEIELVRRKLQQVKSHIARIELEKRLAELQEMKMNQRQKEPWEM